MRYCTKHKKEIPSHMEICQDCYDQLGGMGQSISDTSSTPDQNPVLSRLKAEGIEIEVDSLPTENYDMSMGEGKIGGKTPTKIASLHMSGRSCGKSEAVKEALFPGSTLAELSAIQNTLQERGNRYGKFSGHAKITQDIKSAMAQSKNWNSLSASHAEALEMIAHKIGRILNGDPNYADSWHDIAGYATLVDKQLQGIDQ